MARIVLGSYLVRYPLGGMMSWVLQYLVGFQRLGHDVTFVEKSGYQNSCYDPVRDVMSDDCSYGTKTVAALLERFGLGGRWCFVDADGRYHGLSAQEAGEALATADVFVDMGTHGDWLPEARDAALRVLIDGEPGFTQMKMELRRRAGETLPEYDFYYSTGQNIGTPHSTAPAAGKAWRHIFHPAVIDLFPAASAPREAFTTVMNWQSYEPLKYDGAVFGHKDVEFRKFETLPSRTDAELEVAVSGRHVSRSELESAGWRVRDAHEVTRSFDSFVEYVGESRGEFSVCKSGYVLTRSGWFSDRSAAYLASGRPVVLQDTGFSEHLPCGEGLFGAATVAEAAAALAEIEAHYERHSRTARDLAAEHLQAERVLARFLEELTG